MGSLRVHKPAIWSAPSLLSTTALPEKSGPAPPLLGLGRVAWTQGAAALRRVVRAAPSLARISFGPSPPLGPAWSCLASLAWRRLSSALAGVCPLSAATVPRGVDQKTPSADLPIRLMALWYPASTPTPPLQVSSEAQSMVPSVPHKAVGPSRQALAQSPITHLPQQALSCYAVKGGGGAHQERSGDAPPFPGLLGLSNDHSYRVHGRPSRAAAVLSRVEISARLAVCTDSWLRASRPSCRGSWATR